MSDSEGFLLKILKELSSDLGPVIKTNLKELVEKIISENSEQLEMILCKLIEDISLKYKIDFAASNGLSIKVVQDGIKIDADFIISVKKKQNGQEISVASLQIPFHPAIIKLEQLLIKISKTKLDIRHG